MAKGKASSSFACPGCRQKFDVETHAPFMGSCGHSLCGICVNEKEIKDCPICNKEGGFSWNQKNELAIEFLASAAAERGEEDSKKPRFFIEGERSVPGEAVAAIANPENRPFLSKIVNQLDPISFVNLASTCKSLHNFCFNSKDVRITYDISSVDVFYSRRDSEMMFRLADRDYELERFCFTCYRDRRVDYAGFKAGFLGSVVNRRKLRNYPFVFSLKKLKIKSSLSYAFLAALRSFLAEFPVKKITEVDIRAVDNWDNLIQLVKDYDIIFVNIRTIGEYEFPGEVEESRIPEEVAAYFLQNMAAFESDDNISLELILNATVKTLELPWTNISQTAFFEILKKLSDSTVNLHWDFRLNSFEFGHYDLFKVLPFNHEGPLPEERPLVFVKDDEPQEFWLLRNDGKILSCSYERPSVYFSSDSEYPPCLQG